MSDSIITSVSEAEPAGQALKISVYASPTRSINGGTFSPTTSILISGSTDAILVDAQAIKQDVDALSEMIERTGLKLTTIFITHGHPDHYFGAAQLAKRFPGLQVVAAPGVVEYINKNLEQNMKTWAEWFGDDVVSPDLLPTALKTDSIPLEGRDLRVIQIGQGDIAPSTILQIPELDALIVGDIAYNKIHLMLALGGPKEWSNWIASVDELERLKPRVVVVGHKKPGASDDDVATILGGTRSYIRDFGEAVKTSDSADAVVEIMKAKYPDYGNPWTLEFSAKAAMKQKAA
ncbi:MBL fold metallo-hydrolase [Nostoc sp.]|uniref:MBL fold metallo-hydrolase n=1 Tax=Nostoc sp. TaxID=1180 RepID=UPI002FFAE492